MHFANRGDPASDGQAERCYASDQASVYVESEKEASRHKWLQSEKAGYDLGPAAVQEWCDTHWWGFLRAKWVEHLQGVRYWVELDKGDFGLIKREFRDDPLLLDLILDRLKNGKENLDIIVWALDWGIPCDRVLNILEALDINSRRLAHQLDR